MRYRYETHMHTYPASQCAGSLPSEQVRAYRSRGYAGIIVTDHFVNGSTGCPPGLSWDEQMRFFLSGYEQAKKEGDLCGLDVFLGWEYNINGTEFLTYGLEPDFLPAHPGMDTLTAKQYSALVRKHGGYLAQAHPYRSARWIASPHPVSPRLVDGLEVYNASMPDEVNRRAREFARLHHLPMQAGSDAHHTGIPFVSGVMLAERAKSAADVIAAIKTGRAELIVPGA